MEFFIKSKVCVSRHTPNGSAPNLGAALFHACAHMRTRARNAHARARAHMRVIILTCYSRSSSSVENVKKHNLQRSNVKIKHFLMLKELLKNR